MKPSVNFLVRSKKFSYSIRSNNFMALGREEPFLQIMVTSLPIQRAALSSRKTSAFSGTERS